MSNNRGIQRTYTLPSPHVLLQDPSKYTFHEKLNPCAKHKISFMNSKCGDMNDIQSDVKRMEGGIAAQ